MNARITKVAKNRPNPIVVPIWATTTMALAATTWLPVGTSVIAGTVDAYAEGFSVGVRQPGDRMLMYGSTMFLVQIIGAYFTDPALWTTAGGA
jgi:xylulokinase